MGAGRNLWFRLAAEKPGQASALRPANPAFVSCNPPTKEWMSIRKPELLHGLAEPWLSQP